MTEEKQNNLPEITYLASYKDIGKSRFLTSITFIDSFNDYDHNLFIKISKEVYEYLKENFPNLGFYKICTKSDVVFVESIDQLENIELTMTKEERFELEKTARIVRVENMLYDDIDLRVIKDFFQFTIQNNRLLAEGIIITDENREEKYLELLRNTKSTDPALKKKAVKIIDILSDYLEAMDHLSSYLKIFETVEKFKDEIHDCETEEELNNVSKKYDRELFGNQ